MNPKKELLWGLWVRFRGWDLYNVISRLSFKGFTPSGRQGASPQNPSSMSHSFELSSRRP